METELKLYVGESAQMHFLLTPENNRPTLIFTSDDEKIATVEREFGFVTGLTPGTCRIMVKDLESGVEAEYTVVVQERTKPEESGETEVDPERPDHDGVDKEGEEENPSDAEKEKPSDEDKENSSDHDGVNPGSEKEKQCDHGGVDSEKVKPSDLDTRGFADVKPVRKGAESDKKITPVDGKAENIKNFDGKSIQNGSAVNTGDDSNPWLWSFMMLVSLLGLNLTLRIAS